MLCSVCTEIMPRTSFSARQRKKNNSNRACRVCAKKSVAERRTIKEKKPQHNSEQYYSDQYYFELDKLERGEAWAHAYEFAAEIFDSQFVDYDDE